MNDTNDSIIRPYSHHRVPCKVVPFYHTGGAFHHEMRHTHTLKEWWAWNPDIQAYVLYVGSFEGCPACD